MIRANLDYKNDDEEVELDENGNPIDPEHDNLG
jgi:hypothetical protein